MAPPFLQLSTIGSSLDDHHDLDAYDHHRHRDLFNNLEHQSSFSSTTTTTTSSLSSPLFLSPPQIHGVVSDHYYREPHNFQFQLLEADRIVSYGGSYDHHDQALGDEKGDVINLGIDHINHEGDDDQTKDHENRSSHGENVSSVKWMSSKMRIMRKMTNSDHQAISNMHNNTTKSATTSRVNFEENQKKLNSSLALGIPDSSSNTNPIRVCSDCHTTKTPLWRSGPKGPKSLCNACGIRKRKARRAMAETAAAANGMVEAAPSLIKTSKVKLKDNKTIPFKKRCHKLAIIPSPKRKSKTTKIRLGDFSVSNDMDQTSGTVAPASNAATTATSTGFQRVFPQDEKEAAILLMALSCGLVRG